MKFHQSLFVLTAIVSFVHPALAQPAKSELKYRVEILKTIRDLKLVQSKLAAKVTICNGGKILTRFCPRPPQPTIEPTGKGSIVRALQQINQTIATLELYLKSIDRQ
jgi:hypothetical protein